MNGFVIFNKQYDKVLYTPHLHEISLFFVLPTYDIRNNSHEVIARSYCDEILPKPMEQTIYRDMSIWN